MLSNGNIFYLEVFCIIAVKKLIGLNKYEIQRDLGVVNYPDHCYNCVHLSISSLNHKARVLRDGYATLYQLAGTLLNCKER
jgi:hypothetical protein